jgi:hypothetical protein
MGRVPSVSIEFGMRAGLGQGRARVNQFSSDDYHAQIRYLVARIPKKLALNHKT